MEHCALKPCFLAKTFPQKTPKTTQAALILVLDFNNEVEARTQSTLKPFLASAKIGLHLVSLWEP